MEFGGGHIAPAWFAPAMNTALNTALAPLNERMERVEQKLGVVAAAVSNRKLEFQNRNLLGSPGLDRPWLPLNKERRHFGLAPPGTQGNNNETPQAVLEVFAGPAPEPGEDVVPPPEIFPTDRSVSLTQVQIGYISRWYNNDFGVRVGDNAEARTKKFHDFLYGQ
eukprot:CAMPEP_0184327176 /NCGR_PEP_ID=MMETSP1049-20130417/142940_1 /TAXON_ID=77928 /ORGANISM="Proteomonas sulcata, Strain CCMP704" /LENGTH=164 /DNA_ID=CAMNT_0026649415 /DNA_START=1795 /DNA_END=2289 /DNA_ORIENTATION=-